MDLSSLCYTIRVTNAGFSIQKWYFKEQALTMPKNKTILTSFYWSVTDSETNND